MGHLSIRAMAYIPASSRAILRSACKAAGLPLGALAGLAAIAVVLLSRGPTFLSAGAAALDPRTPSPGELALEGRTGERLPPRDRLVAMEHAHTREKVVFHVGPGGHVRSDEMPVLERFFSCQRTKRRAPISPRLVELLADIAERWPGRVIELLSGLRSPPDGAPSSKHYIGHAIDMRVRGVRSTDVRDFVWAKHRAVGVGHYPEDDFVHVDARSADQEIAWSGHEESTRLEYHPRWAEQARESAVALWPW